MRKNYRKIPPHIEAKLPRIDSEMVVATVSNISAADLSNGVFSQLGLTVNNGQPTVQPPAIPNTERGRYSRYNVEGQTVVRRDLPKYTKDITFEVPCFGDWSNMVSVTQHRQVYVRQELPPRGYAIATEVLATRTEGGCVAKFAVTTPFTQGTENFERELLFAVNLLFESTQSANIFSSGSSIQEFLGSINVAWVILPPGERDENIRLIITGLKNPNQEMKERVHERYAFFESLRPRHIIRGSGGMDGYLGAEVSDDLVVFENMRDGNAIYILFADWRERSQQTKTELLAHAVEGIDYVRIIHSEGWEARVHSEVNTRLRRQ
jgi:hypothetical protein